MTQMYYARLQKSNLVRNAPHSQQMGDDPNHDIDDRRNTDGSHMQSYTCPRIERTGNPIDIVVSGYRAVVLPSLTFFSPSASHPIYFCVIALRDFRVARMNLA